MNCRTDIFYILAPMVDVITIGYSVDILVFGLNMSNMVGSLMNTFIGDTRGNVGGWQWSWPVC